jgi:FAD/FMN-containing dehydrogenase
MSGGICDTVVLRPLLGTGEVRFPPADADAVRAAVRNAGGRLLIKRGDVDPVGVPDDVALDLMRSVKRRLDPAGTLSPGRQIGGI